MSPGPSALLWSWRGLADFLAHPGWWWRPILWSLLAGAVLLTVVIAVWWWRWPAWSDHGWWGYFGHALLALAWIGGSTLLMWVLILPEFIMLGMEGLCRRALTLHRVPLAETGMVAGSAASLRVTLNSLPSRLLWILGAAIAALIFGPLGLVITAVAMGRWLAFDCANLALGLCGYSGAERLALLRQYRGQLLQAGLGSAALKLLLSLTIIGWLLWIPAAVAGAARWMSTIPPRGKDDGVKG